MKILPVSRNSSKNFKYHKKDITANQYNTNPLKEIYFTSLISNSDLIKMGFKPANIQNNKIINPDEAIIITSAEKFIALTNSPNVWNKRIVLSKDINLEGKKIKPIGSASKPFKGVFDGNGCKISNFVIEAPKNRNIGLFGKIENANISNVEITNAYFEGNQYVGAIAGQAINSEFANCYAQSYTKGTKKVGGLVGGSVNNTIRNCGTIGNIQVNKADTFDPFGFDETIETPEAFGGLIGSDSGSLIENSYSSSNLKGEEQVGGLIGYSINTNITNSLFNGIIDANSRIGSLIGWAENCTISRSYTLSNIKEYIGTSIGNSLEKVFNNCVDLIESQEYFWENKPWIKPKGKIPRLLIQLEKASPVKIFLEDVNIDIEAERIVNPYRKTPIEKFTENIPLNITAPKHFSQNDELLREIKNCNDEDILFSKFNEFVLGKQYTNSDRSIKDEYKEVLLEFVKNPKMNLNRHYTNTYCVGCTPLFIITTINEPYILAEALKRDDVDPMIRCGFIRNKTILSRVLENHMDSCFYVLLTSQKTKKIIEQQLNSIKALEISPLARFLIETYPNIPKYDTKTGIMQVSKEIKIPEDIRIAITKVKKLQDVLANAFIDSNYKDSLGNNIANILTFLEDEQDALSVLLAAEKNYTDLNNKNNKYETPIGHALYRKMPHIVARLLPKTNTPYVRLDDGTDSMLLFSNIPDDTLALNYMQIARNERLSVNSTDKLGNTPLINAINQKNYSSIKYLLACGANPNMADSSGQTPLHHACLNNDTTSIGLLLNSYAYPFIEDELGNIAKDYLNSETKKQIESDLQNFDDLWLSSDFGMRYTATQERVNYDEFSWIFSLDDYFKENDSNSVATRKIINATKNIIADPSTINYTDNYGNTLMHLIAQNKNQYASECLKAILEKGGNLNAKNSYNETPLMCALNEYICSTDPEDKVNLLRNIIILLKASPDIDLIDNNKQSALHKVCQSGNAILLNEILKLNPKINQVDVLGKTAFEYIPQKNKNVMYYIAKEYLKSFKIIKEEI